MAIVAEEGGEFQRGNKEIGEDRTSEQNAASVGEAVNATSEDNRRRAFGAARARAADGANGDVGKKKKK